MSTHGTETVRYCSNASHLGLFIFGASVGIWFALMVIWAIMMWP